MLNSIIAAVLCVKISRHMDINFVVIRQVLIYHLSQTEREWQELCTRICLLTHTPI